MKNLATKNIFDFTITESGDAFTTQRVAAKLCGVDQTAIAKISSSKNLDVSQGLTPEVLSLLIKYYAIESKAANDTARLSLAIMAEAGCKAWMYHEAGYTIKAEKPKTQLELAREQVLMFERLEQIENERDLAQATKAEIGSRREATSMNTASQAVKKVNKLEIELDQSKDYCTIKRMEMIQHGQKFKWRLLKSAGIEMGIEPIDVFDSNYGTVKSYHRDVWMEAYAIDTGDSSTEE